MEFDDFDDLFGTENLEENEDEEDPTNGKGIRDNENLTADEKTKLLNSVWEKADEETKAKLRTKRVQLKLTERELTAEEKGLPALKEALDGYQFPQGAHTYEKLDLLLGQIECWAHHLFPQMNFDDFLEKIEKLGHKRMVKNTMKRLRLGLPLDADMDIDGKDVTSANVDDAQVQEDEKDWNNSKVAIATEDDDDFFWNEEWSASMSAKKKQGPTPQKNIDNLEPEEKGSNDIEQALMTNGGRMAENKSEENLLAIREEDSRESLEPELIIADDEETDLNKNSDFEDAEEEEPIPKTRKRKIIIEDDDE